MRGLAQHLRDCIVSTRANTARASSGRFGQESCRWRAVCGLEGVMEKGWDPEGLQPWVCLQVLG